MARITALLVLSMIAAALLAPGELTADKTVGHQARVERARRIDAKPEPTEPRVCAANEPSTDRDPCLGANGRLGYQPGR